MALDSTDLLAEPILPARVDTEDLTFEPERAPLEYEDRTALDHDMELHVEEQRQEGFEDSTHVDYTEADQTIEDATETAKEDRVDLRAQILSGAFPRADEAATRPDRAAPRPPDTKPTMPALFRSSSMDGLSAPEEETFLERTASVVEVDTLNLGQHTATDDSIEDEALGGVRVRWLWFAPIMVGIVAVAAVGTWVLLTSKPL